MQIDVLGIDLAKRVFQLHGVTAGGAVVHRSKVSRPSLLLAIERLEPRLVVMEACASAHHWARQLLCRGIAVKLISPQFVVPFVKTNKNDRNDAEGIVEAASRPAMRFVAVKSVEQQDIQAIHRLRELFVHQRTAVINHVRAVLAERGVIVGKSPAAFHKAMPSVLASEAGEVTIDSRALLVDALQHLNSLEARIEAADVRIRHLMTSSELCQRIGQIPGVGPLTATAVVAAVGDAKQFKNGRHLAAWLGIVPRQHSSGGRSRLGGISKRGDAYLRTLLIHGARSVLRWLGDKQDAHSRWLRELIDRRGHNCAAVALANKNARIIQAVLSSDRTYRPEPAR
ncbi:MAG: IS110 family transposase [Acidobacteriota bacterium]|nr:IS110 family transposase [Acidobacteriota bacterium]